MTGISSRGSYASFLILYSIVSENWPNSSSSLMASRIYCAERRLEVSISRHILTTLKTSGSISCSRNFKVFPSDQPCGWPVLLEFPMYFSLSDLETLSLSYNSLFIKANFYFVVSVGPMMSRIKDRVSRSFSPGNSGSPFDISHRMQPTDHKSTDWS